MSKSYRIRTQPGVDKSIKVLIDQEFDYLEILSLKILQSDIYTRQCSDYGVIVGRVSVNNGFGIPNAKVSVFIPIDSIDQSDPIISELYPYKSLSDVNDDGYRYNLLPYVKSYSAHIPTGTFFTRTDVLTNPTLIKVYDKYYKYNATTNDSGDYMIFGVPVGVHTVVLDVDLSDIGEFSLSPQDLIRMGISTEAQVSGPNFKSSNNLRELPQLVTVNRTIEVEPLWGQPEICNLGITRTDFDLSSEANVDIRPTSIFMGSIISGPNSSAVSSGCRPPNKLGHLCDLTTGPGEILAIRQTIQQDSNGRPILENFSLEGGGKVIDENGTWLIDVPMNLDYYITNEFGEQVLSNDPEKGIPTRGKYRFKVKWSQSPSLSETTRRAYFLVPNIKEYDTNPESIEKSYAFSVDWNDYGTVDTITNLLDINGGIMVQSAIDCDDKFYVMQYNKVYTVSQYISGFRSGTGIERYIGIKNILDETCSGLNYRFPTNDGNFRFDILYIIFMFFSIILTPVFFALILVMHILYFVIWLLRKYLIYIFIGWALYQAANSFIQSAATYPAVGLTVGFILLGLFYIGLAAFFRWFQQQLNKINLNGIKVPILTYPECNLCDCKQGESNVSDGGLENELGSPPSQDNERVPCVSIISDTTISSVELIPGILPLFQTGTIKIPNRTPTNPTGFLPERTIVYSQELTGVVYDGQYVSNNVGAPYLTNTQNQNDVLNRWIYTTSLPIADRINLFNLKAKYFNGTSSVKPCFGFLYNFYTVMDTQISSDNTWRVPIKNDFENLVNYLTGSSKDSNNLRLVDQTTYWDISNDNASNTTGFNSIGSGVRNDDGFSGIKNNLSYRSKTSASFDLDWKLTIESGVPDLIITSGTSKNDGCPVRLVKTSTTLTNGQTGTYTGNDGTIYTTICIGTQEWLSQDLRETKYRDTTPIPNVTDQTIWSGLTSKAYCVYDNSSYYIGGCSSVPTSSPSSYPDNPGGGVNIISVNFNPSQPTYHTDNTIVILCDKKSLKSLKSGQLIAFQNPTVSKDINLNGGILNEYGNNAITGTTYTGTTGITVTYANPDGTGNLTKIYSGVTITAITTNNFHKFPTDIEYFQVITGMTYSEFTGQCSNDIGYDSLNNRYISNDTLIGQDYVNGTPTPDNVTINPIQYVKDYEQQCVLILNRGVDPYTPKVPISYGLGRLFGRTNLNDVTVSGLYHMNIPIQGKFLNISHAMIDFTAGSNVATESVYSNQNLYFNSFSYKPQVNTITGSITGYTGGTKYVYTGVTNSGYSSFTSNLISYYSSMDNRNTQKVICGGIVGNVKDFGNDVAIPHNTYGIKVSPNNRFSWRIQQITLPSVPNVDRTCEGKKFNYIGSFTYGPFLYTVLFTPLLTSSYSFNNYTYQTNTKYNLGYFPNEIIEGGPVMYTNLELSQPIDCEIKPYPEPPCPPCLRLPPKTKYDVTNQDDPPTFSVTSNYYSPIYDTTGNTLNFSLGSNDNQIIMRADRLPTSTNVDEYCCNGMVLQKNTNFKIYLIPEDGVLSVTSAQGSTETAGSGELQYTTEDLKGSENINKIFGTFTCEGSVNLSCYGCNSSGLNSTITVADSSCQRYLGETIFEFGCYRFISTIFLSLVYDWGLMFEWIARNMVMLGACRNVFSHKFINNWVNGTLYTFPIKTEIIGYTSPTSNPPNTPIPKYCENVVYFHKLTRNYYYKSSKYSISSDSFGVYGDPTHIGFPTTIMDLGPRADFLQELVMSDEYDGYVVNKLDSSSFGTVDDLLNLFIVSRFVGNGTLDLIVKSNIFAYFSNNRPSNGVTGTRWQIDADYAQLISINSELGVAPFLSSNYPDNPLLGEQNPIYFNCDNVMGVFFSSDTQIRDYITPKRTIINGDVTINSSCSFNNFPVYSQRVPFSQWSINYPDNESIFGRQFNNWEYNVNGNVFSHKYQSLDRLDANSRYFRTNGSTLTKYQKGHIYAVYSSSTSSALTITADQQYWDNNALEPNLVTVGAPFHFYFGLRRGASSFDRFKTKWINSSNVTN